MTAPAAVDPPRIGPGSEGRAVYLVHVVAWLMQRDELARDDAWRRVLDAISGPAPCTVYHLPPGGSGYAVPMVRDEWFATASGAPGRAGGGRVFSRGIDSHGVRIHTPPPPAAVSLGRGPTGLAAWMRAELRHSGVDAATGHAVGLAAGFAVAEGEARRLWGWGAETDAPPAKEVPTNLEGLVASFKDRRKGAPWTDGERAILRAEFHRLGGWRRADDGTWAKVSAVQVEMAQKLGMSRQALDRHLGKSPDHAASAFASMGTTLTGTR